MSIKLHYFAAKLITVTSFAWSIAISSAAAQQLPSAVDAFVTAANALAKSANERVDLGRASMRLNQLKAGLTEKVLAPAPDNKIRLSFDTQNLLCNVRASNVEVAARRNYIQAVAGKVEAVGKPSKIDNLKSAFKALFSGQSLDITTGIPTREELEAERKKIEERCQKDISGFALAYYGKDIVPPEQIAKFEAAPLGGFGPIGALIEAIVAVITPVIIEGAKFVDEAKRENAVLEFLRDAGNRKKIQELGHGVS